MAVFSVSAASVWSAVKATVNVLYKAAFLYLAFTFVTAELEFQEFEVSAIKVFYTLAKGLSS